MLINIEDVVVKDNIRSEPGNIDELAQSIRQHGQAVPILVEEPDDDGNYVLVYGHRRLLACMLLGKEVINATVHPYPLNDEERILLQYAENAERNDLNYIEKAMTMKRLKDGGMAQTEIAENMGISTTAVSLAINTLELPEKLQDAIRVGRISPSAVEPLLPLSFEEQEQLADAVIKNRTVRKVESIVYAHKQTQVLEEVIVEERNDDEDPILEYVNEQVGQAIQCVSNALAMLPESAVLKNVLEQLKIYNGE